MKGPAPANASRSSQSASSDKALHADKTIASPAESRQNPASHPSGPGATPRQASAGSQLLLLHLMEQQGLDAGDVSFSEIAHTETDAVASVLDGSADATLGLRSVALRFRLEFVPLMRERFDLLVDRRAWFEPAFQSFLSFCRSDALRERAEVLQGYDVSGFGKVHFNG